MTKRTAGITDGYINTGLDTLFTAVDSLDDIIPTVTEQDILNSEVIQ